MKTLRFRTNIDCMGRFQQAVCGLACLHGRYCQLNVDLLEATHLLTLTSDSLTTNEVIDALQREGISCQQVSEE
ncbi:hypothetical protein GO755_28205 [Spirosoma sp. HMF4905]|uniref:Heavy-metal-associated domain-containing protein n=1 Tax=Spirosoma arboris TaxID=2682092 RepID=A0A7K1SJF6_9BACT|nr:hypothetical protein [Spirosoma arboris]MVM33951.1 hypothetical protein [Spirosoma arboris]